MKYKDMNEIIDDLSLPNIWTFVLLLGISSTHHHIHHRQFVSHQHHHQQQQQHMRSVLEGRLGFPNETLTFGLSGTAELCLSSLEKVVEHKVKKITCLCMALLLLQRGADVMNVAVSSGQPPQERRALLKLREMHRNVRSPLCAELQDYWCVWTERLHTSSLCSRRMLRLSLLSDSLP